jgi:hypothetical protein
MNKDECNAGLVRIKGQLDKIKADSVKDGVSDSVRDDVVKLGEEFKEAASLPEEEMQTALAKLNDKIEQIGRKIKRTTSAMKTHIPGMAQHYESEFSLPGDAIDEFLKSMDWLEGVGDIVGLERTPHGKVMDTPKNRALCDKYVKDPEAKRRFLQKAKHNQIDKPEWPSNIPFPAMWRKRILAVHRNDKAMVNNYLANKECRTFCFSKKLIDALKDVPCDEIPTELVKLPMPVTYLDFSECDGFQHEIDGRKYISRGCLLTMDAGRLRMLTVNYTPGDTYQLSFSIGAHNALGKIFTAPAVKFLKLAINALLYINSVNADLREEWLVKNTKKGTKDKRKRDREKVTRAGYYLYIPTVSDGGGEPKNGRKIDVRYICRGHFRHYWIGPRRGEQKRVVKWIAPHWKGPEAADKIHEKMFIVDTKK